MAKLIYSMVISLDGYAKAAEATGLIYARYRTR